MVQQSTRPSQSLGEIGQGFLHGFMEKTVHRGTCEHLARAGLNHCAIVLEADDVGRAIGSARSNLRSSG